MKKLILVFAILLSSCTQRFVTSVVTKVRHENGYDVAISKGKYFTAYFKTDTNEVSVGDIILNDQAKRTWYKSENATTVIIDVSKGTFIFKQK